MPKLMCLHADTCLSDYWGGHHLPHIQIPAYRMTADELRKELQNELRDGAIGGSEDVSEDQDWIDRAKQAVQEMEITKDIVFEDIECDEDHDVYAFFVFKEM